MDSLFIPYALAENRVQFIEKLVDSIPGLIFIYDLKHHCNIYVNDRIRAIFGYTPEEVQGMGREFIHSLIHPSDIPVLIENTRRFQNSPPGTVFTQTYRMKTKDGLWRWMEDHSRILTRDADGKPLSLLGVSTDVTERIIALQELEKSEIRNRSLFEDAPCPIFISDLEGRVVRINRTGANYLQTTPEQCQGRRLGDLIPELELSIPSLIQRVVESRDIVEFFNCLELPVGQRWFQARLRPLFSQSNEVEQIQVVAHDVSEAQKANEDMIKTQAELESILGSISDGFFACDRNFTITYFNEAAEDILGRSAVEVLGKNLFDAFPEVRDTTFETNYRCAMEHGRPINFEEYFDAPRYRNWYDVRVYPSHNGITVYFQVTTNKKTAEHELKRYAESQAALVREVNHRVKNNLATIQSLLNIEKQRAQLADDSRYSATVDILRTRIRGLATVHSMLSESGWIPLRIETVVQRIVNASFEGVQRRIEFTVVQEDDSLTVDSDQAHHLALAICELTTNSLKYAATQSPGKELVISVSIKACDGHFCIEFRDNGPGFPDHVLRKPTTSGIGMELLHGLIQHSLRGKVKLMNDNGAHISMRVPRHDPTQGDEWS